MTTPPPDPFAGRQPLPHDVFSTSPAPLSGSVSARTWSLPGTAILSHNRAVRPACLTLTRWRTLVEGFTGGDPEVQTGLNKMWADKENWPSQERDRFHIDPRVQAFIVKAMKATR